METTYFASGSNRAGEIRGFSEIGHAVGVVADEVMKSDSARGELLRLADSDVKVFLDSGAFSEVEFGPEGPKVVRPISDAEWRRRLAFAEELAEVLGPRLYVVAPDKVGFPGETLGRLSRYRREVRRIAARGARVLVALQGEDKVDFWRKVRFLNLAPEGQLVAALPMKKNATSDDAVVEFCATVRPAGLHLLGLGAANARTPGILERIAAASPRTEVSLDSNLIRANVGRKGRAPRKLTAALDAVADDLAYYAFREPAPGQMGESPGDYTDLIGTPSIWASAADLVEVAAELNLEPAEVRSLRRDPDSWFSTRYDDPRVELAFDAVWARRVHRMQTSERKRRSIKIAFPNARAGANRRAGAALPRATSSESQKGAER